MNDCIFCKIISGEVPSHKIYEDENTLAFLDINPVNPGHTLVTPKGHYKNIYDIPENLFCNVMNTVKKLSSVIKKAVNADGINIEMNNDHAAGQIIFHTHIHIVPRFENDGFKHWPGRPYAEGEIEEVVKKIRERL